MIPYKVSAGQEIIAGRKACAVWIGNVQCKILLENMHPIQREYEKELNTEWRSGLRLAKNIIIPTRAGF